MEYHRIENGMDTSDFISKTTNESDRQNLSSTQNSIASVKKPSLISSAVVVFCVLIGDTARGVLFPTLWLLIESLGGSKSHQGLAVAAFSLGRIISSPILGEYSELYGNRIVLIVSNLIMAAGSIIYICSNSIWIVVLAQATIGFGAGRYDIVLLLFHC